MGRGGIAHAVLCLCANERHNNTFKQHRRLKMNEIHDNELMALLDIEYRYIPYGHPCKPHGMNTEEIANLTETLNAVLIQPPYHVFLKLSLWIRQVKFLKGGLTQNEMLTLFHELLALRNATNVTNSYLLHSVIEPLFEEGFLKEVTVDRWTPGMPSGTGKKAGYRITKKGEKEGEKIYSNPNSPPLTSPIEMDVANYPYQIQAAHGVGVPAIVEAYEASIENTDGTPADVCVKNIGEIENAVFHGTLQAHFVAKNPDEKHRNYALYKSGITPYEIAKSEHPDLESEYGKEEATKIWKSEANRIQKQIERLQKNK